MSARRLPVRPELRELEQQAVELLRALRAGEPGALEELRNVGPEGVDPAAAELTDAQLVRARSYAAPSWARLVQACELSAAIWRDDADRLRELLTAHPQLLHESVLPHDSNWGPPLTYAANLGRDRLLELLRRLGARDLESALGRAVLQSQIGTARMLHAWLGKPPVPEGALAGPAYTLSVPGTELLLELGARVRDEHGARLAPVDVVLESDSRKPAAKHRILELYAQHGLELPDTAPLAVHRGRSDLLEEHLRRDPQLLRRTFRHEELYPPELGCHDEVLATHGTPLGGATLLHLCVDYDELELARWLLARGMHPDARAAVDADGFGGHTALFATVVSQPAFWMNHERRAPTAPLTELLLEKGADPNAVASLKKQLHPGYGPSALHEYRAVTPRQWGERFHDQRFVNAAALERIAARGGR
ncbi:MAG: ankyrin repeat domain-containing protein [Planctomycetes bacterium]|nr:ankyrin repeat domain-containing protein [Planctomycetota bacterium]